jgi:hypothetical protein
LAFEEVQEWGFVQAFVVFLGRRVEDRMERRYLEKSFAVE